MRRLKQTKGLIKQIGLSTYALSHIRYPNPFYEDVADQALGIDELKAVPQKEMHGYVEGMLVELGNFNNYDTYTADSNVVFNGKPLGELATYRGLPQFTYPSILDKVGRIDVIWFEDGFPIKTFDVENSTDFTKALFRAFQLKSFKTRFYMVANANKKSVYDNRVNTKPFDSIKDNTEFVPYLSVYELYKDAAIMSKKIKSSAIFNRA